MAPRVLFTQFNQPLTLINNIAPVTRAWQKNPYIWVIPRRLSVRSDSVLLFLSGQGTVAAYSNGISMKGTIAMKKDARPFWTFMTEGRAK